MKKLFFSMLVAGFIFTLSACSDPIDEALADFETPTLSTDERDLDDDGN